MSEDKEQGVERVRVNLVPLTSTWTCPKCNYQNTHRQGIVSDPQNICGVCMTKVELGAIRVSDLVQRPVVNPQRGIEIPDWLDVDKKIHDTRCEYDITPLERFVHEYEPANDGPKWRASLKAALLSCIQPAADHCWHCGVVLAEVPKFRCEDCPTECDEPECDAFGCERGPVEQTVEQKGS